MRFDVFTLFPAMFESPFGDSIIRRAIEAGRIVIRAHNVRDWAAGKHKITDDYAFGGGGGMVMKPDPIFLAVEAVLGLPSVTPDAPRPRAGGPVILLSAAGRVFNHAVARELSGHERISLICGHYEGVDERVRAGLCDDEISLGDFVLTGGELAAMTIIDAVSRLVPGVLPEFAPVVESHAIPGLLEYPHYTRPADFRGWHVPEVLLSGDHARISRWRREQAVDRSRRRGASLPAIW